MDLNVTIVYRQDEAGWWIAEIPEIPGAFSQGKTRDEAREMVIDAANELAIARRERAMKQARVQSETPKLAGQRPLGARSLEFVADLPNGVVLTFRLRKIEGT